MPSPKLSLYTNLTMTKKMDNTNVVDANGANTPAAAVSTAVVAFQELPVPGAVQYVTHTQLQHRLLWQPEGRDFDPNLDLIIDVNGSFPALEAIADYVSDGRIAGDGNLVLVATAKLGREMGTGIEAYVNAYYRDGDYVATYADGTKRPLIVQGKLPEAGGWKCVRLDGHGNLYIDPNEPTQFAHGQFGGWLAQPRYAEQAAQRSTKTYLYWRLTALEAILKGRHVSVSFPANARSATFERAQQIWQGVRMDDRLNANRERRQVNKSASRSVYQTVSTPAEERNNDAPVDPNALLVDTNIGTEFDLTTLKRGSFLRVMPRDGGFTTRRPIVVGDLHELQEIAMWLADVDFVVVAS